MESQTFQNEQAASRKAYIDFYRQQEASQQQQNKPMLIQQYDDVQDQYVSGNMRGQLSDGGFFGNNNNKNAISNNNRAAHDIDQYQEVSPIYGTQQHRREPRSDNFMDLNSQNQSSRAKEEQKRQANANIIDKQVASKRKSLDTKDNMAKTLKNEQSASNRYSGQQIKSAMGNYGTQQFSATGPQQQIKQINRDNKIERDPVLDNISQQYNLTQQQKRTLAKSQSQNKLLLVSPETLMNKNNPYQEMMNDNGSNSGVYNDKNSFIKEQLNPSSRVSGQVADVMYKQHMQYSSNGQQNHHKGWQLKTNNHQSNMILSRLSTNNCTFCNKTHGGGIHSSSTIPHCSAIFCSKDQQGVMISKRLSEKYSTNRDYYNLKIVNDLIYNENTHVVSIFKDYLILDDINEFLKRYYTQPETKTRLPKLCSFYDKYSQVFPNYVVLPESKYMFKNIQRKQKLIDEQYQLQEHLANKPHLTLQDDDKLFNTKFYNSYYSMMGNGNDISMTKKQYEEQAKQIATQAGRKVPVRAIDQMRIDELVDRFLMKDSESNIQLQTTTGLDFSGFTHVNSSIMNHNPDIKLASAIKPSQQQSKVTTQTVKTVSTNVQVLQQAKTQIAQNRNSQHSAQNTVQARKKASTYQPGQGLTTNTNNGSQTSSASNKRQKGSFNNNQVTNKQPTQNQNLKIATNKNDVSGSNKTTPRINKNAPYTQTNVIILDSDKQNKPTIQTSPATKEAIHNYLQCQMELNSTPDQQQQQLPIDSPNIKSPVLTSKQLQLVPTGSQTQLGQPQQTNNLSLTTTNTRQNMKSQQNLMVTSAMGPQGIANLKKNNRLSQGPTNLMQGKQSMGGTMKKNTSPVPQMLNGQQQFQQTASRNQLIVNNSTQKSTKSINSHAKYLSGGADQYQKILSTINQQQNFETVSSAQKKKSSNTIGKTNQYQQPQRIEQYDPQLDGEAITGEDCDEFGIADERFASPDCNKIVFSTIDEANGRKSIEGLRQQQMLLTSSEDKILSQCNNFDQIKKHLEQYITLNNTSQTNPLQQQTFDNTTLSNSKKFSLGGGAQAFKSIDNNELKGSLTQQSYNQQQQPDSNNSRNGQTQKHFESLKQKIRNAYDQPETCQTIQSANKTPNKSSTHSKKSTNYPQNNQNLAVLQQNRMSIEARDQNNNMMIMVMPSSSTNQGCLSSTAANGRQLSFSQNSFNNNSGNYRSITNIQQRKNSNTNQNAHMKQTESSIEAKRMSGQHNRQSFKDLQPIQTQQQQDYQKVIKRCATGKTLSINDINSHTFGQIQAQNNYNMQSVSSTATLCNPTFISSASNASKVYQTHHQQQNSLSVQQAANTVRVMTPSYSLASLSKIISPTQSTSPMTMTVTLAGGTHTQSRKQLSNPSLVQNIKGKQPQMGMQSSANRTSQQPSNIVSSHSHQNFILADKNQKVITSKQANAHRQKSNITSNLAIQTTNSIQQKLGRQQFQASSTLVQSNSMQNFQVTPRGGPLTASVAQLQQEQQQVIRRTQQAYQLENSANMSYTVSTENNSTAKAIESKNPKFMRTIEQTSNPQPSYNTMLSSQIGHRKTGTGLTQSVSQAQFDLKHQKQKISTVVNSNQPTIKRQSNGQQTLSSSSSVSHFKSPSQQIQTKKQIQSRYGNI